LQLYKFSKILEKISPFIFFLIPISILYFICPESFYGTWEGSWQGRFFYFFFLWICTLEIIIGYERLCMPQCGKKRAFILAILFSPTLYVIIANFFGLNEAIKALAEKNKIYHARLLPLSVEYLVFSILLCVIVISAYGIPRLDEFAMSITFLGVIGLIYVIDQIYPAGRFSPFQFMVFPTTNLAQSLLNILGYQTNLRVHYTSDYGYLAVLSVFDPTNAKFASFGVAWPCAGVESLIIYTLTILLFLKKDSLTRWQKVIYFAFGAIITYLINITRIVLIYLIAIKGGDVWIFHNFYGPLMSISWIASYPLLILGIEALWAKSCETRIRKIYTHTRNIC